MKTLSRSALVLGVCLGASLSSPGQVILNPNQISGNVSFNNSTLGILISLGTPINDGMSNIILQASSLPPAPPLVATTGYLPVNNRFNGDYEITVDSDNPGIRYSVSPRVLMQGDRYVYFFNSKTSAPVTIGSTPPALNFASSCPSMAACRDCRWTTVEHGRNFTKSTRNDRIVQAY